jgi:hypothetical protein
MPIGRSKQSNNNSKEIHETASSSITIKKLILLAVVIAFFASLPLIKKIDDINEVEDEVTSETTSKVSELSATTERYANTDNLHVDENGMVSFTAHICSVEVKPTSSYYDFDIEENYVNMNFDFSIMDSKGSLLCGVYYDTAVRFSEMTDMVSEYTLYYSNENVEYVFVCNPDGTLAILPEKNNF